MRATSLSGEFIATIPPPLKHSGKVLKKLCAMQRPNVILLSRHDMVLAVAKICRKHEETYYGIIREHDVLPPGSFPNIVASEDNLVIFSNVPAFSPRVKTLKDALDEKLDAKLIKSALAQIIALLIYAHSRDPRFAHNDLKADNILLTKTSNEFLVIGEHEIETHGVAVVFIDFETVTGTRFPKFKVETTKKNLMDFGLDDSLPFSPWTDLHLVFMEVVRYDVPGFSEFIQHFYPLDHFKTLNPLVTSQNRLNARGRLLNTPLPNLLLDPFFEN